MLYRCEHENCSLVFDRPSKLARHRNLHLGIKSYPCSRADCGKSYSTPSHLKRHIMSSHSSSAKEKNSVLCCSFEQCDAVFSTSWGLRRHEMKHESGFYCEHCELYFKNISTFEKHERKHESKFGRKCANCGRSFINKRKREWIAHKNQCREPHSRSEIPLYQCARCGSCFRIKRLLRSHIGECFSLPPTSSLFLCSENLCGKMFVYQRNLKAHVRCEHLKISYPCSHVQCGKTFRHKKDCSRHEKLHWVPGSTKSTPNALLINSK